LETPHSAAMVLHIKRLEIRPSEMTDPRRSESGTRRLIAMDLHINKLGIRPSAATARALNASATLSSEVTDPLVKLSAALFFATK
jgi:hypothetical protein